MELYITEYIIENRCTTIVPLSTQVIHLLAKLAQITKAKSEYVFPATTSNLKPMSENTINQALRHLGYISEQACCHGFHSSFKKY